MNLYSYLEMAFAAAKVSNDSAKKLTKADQLRLLRDVFNNSEVSDSLGFNISDELLKKAKSNPKIKNLVKATEADLDAANVSSGLKKSKSEIWKLELKDGNTLFFKRTGSGEIGIKSLTPDKLGLSTGVNIGGKLVDKKFTKQKLVKATIDAINKKPYTQGLKSFIISVIEAAGNSKAIAKIPEGSSSNNVMLEMKDFLKKSSAYDAGDMNNLWKDLGEILSAIISCGGSSKAEVYFPKEINRPLVDFFTEMSPGEVVSFSAKAIKKASDGTGKPSLVGLLQYIDINKKILKDDPKEKELYEVLKVINKSSGVGQSYIDLVNHLGISAQAAKDYKTRNKVAYNAKTATPEQTTDYGYSCFKVSKATLNEKYKDTLTTIINAKVNVDQVYLVAPKPNGLMFSFKQFKNMKFKFDASASSKTLDAKMGFTAVLSQKDFQID